MIKPEEETTFLTIRILKKIILNSIFLLCFMSCSKSSKSTNSEKEIADTIRINFHTVDKKWKEENKEFPKEKKNDLGEKK